MSRAVRCLIDRLRSVSVIPEKELGWILQHARRTRSNLRSLVRERASGRPLQLVLGTQPFLNLDILCSETVLIPRPETEHWCSWLAEILQDKLERKQTVLEIGSGTGCVSLSLGKYLPYYQVIGIDIDSSAVHISRKNLRLSRISNVSFHQLSFFDENLQSNLKSLNAEKFDLLISNPPYIAEHEWHQLESDVRRYESPRALCSGHLGLDIIREIIFRCRNYLIPRRPEDTRPSILLEFGQEYQTALIRYWMNESGLSDIEFKKDFSGRMRFVTGRLTS